MIHRPRLRHLGRALAFAALFATGAAKSAFGQASTVPGEIILYMQPGTDQNVATTLANTVNPASVTPLLLKDCYVLKLLPGHANLADTASAVATLKMNPNVRWVSANQALKTMQSTGGGTKITPNDPRFKEQWGLTQINMPQAWTLQKGAANVNLADIDSGFDPLHEDAKGQFLPESFDFTGNTSDITAAVGDDHGVSTSGVFIAITNNATGIAGVCWQNIKCLGLKCNVAGSPGFINLASALNAYTYILTNKDKLHVVAVNLSFGGPGDPNDTSNPEYSATKALVDAGVIVVASAGNSGDQGNPVNLPAAYAHVISVAATDINGKTTGYSEFNKVEIAAPGGDSGATGVPANGVLLLKQGSLYAFEDGTSFASPHVVGALGLLMSVPGVTPAQAKQAMFDTANRKGLALSTLPDPHYGYGVLDVYAALLKVSVSVVIDDPIGINSSGISTDPSGLPPPPTETLKPTLRFKISNVPLANLSIKIDAGTAQEVDLTTAFLQNQVESGNTTGIAPQYVIAFRYQFPNTAPYNHTITVTGKNPNTSTVATDTRTFTIQSHVFPAGISFVSIPYYEAAVDSPTGRTRDAGDLLGPSVLLARWLYVASKDAVGNTITSPSYVFYGSGATVQDPNASLHPNSFVPVPDNSSITSNIAPLGVGYFLNAPGPVTVVTNGQSFDTTSFRIPLHEGWNMIGNPYKFAVPFDGLEFDLPSGTRVTAEAAADQKVILPFIYRYVGGQYQFQTLPAGNLQAWEGQWIYVIPQNPNKPRQDTVLTMITTPVAVSGFAGRAAHKTRLASASGAHSLNTPPKVTGAGSWTVQLQASSKDLHDGYNFIGVTRSAAAANSLVPKPPHPSPYVTLGVSDPNAKGAVYAQDLQMAGGVKTWNVSVMTDQPNTDITLRWPNIATLPKNYRLTLQDTATGQEIDLRNQASYQFNSGHNAVTRAFTLTAHPTNSGGHAVLTNISVNPPRSVPGRAAGSYQIGYTVSQDAQVEVAIVGYNGQTLAQIGATRAVSSGDNTQVWNGRDTKGAIVPAGTYLLQLRAVTTDGTVSREIRPLTITR